MLTPLNPKQRSAALKIDWAKIGSQLGLKGQTASALAAFKKRNDDARRKVQVLSEAPQSVDFESYRAQLNNRAVVDEIEQRTKSFTPKTYDVARQIKSIEAFEAQAVKNAQDTKGAVDKELSELQKTLKNIEEARAFEDLTVVCVCQSSAENRSVALLTLMLFRTTSPKLHRTLIRGSSSSSRTGNGTFQVIRYVSATLCQYTANDPAGEIWRPVATVKIRYFVAV